MTTIFSQTKEGAAAFIDVETTGLSNQDEIVELAISLFQFDTDTGQILKVEDSYSGLREPSIKIPPQVIDIHGITNQDVKNEKLNKEQIAKMIDEAQVLIAHNAQFDKRFVRQLFPQVDDKLWLCSMRGINWKGKGFDSKGLEYLIKKHNISKMQTHRAQDDVDVAIKLLKQKNKKGQPYFYELIQKD
ncbi:exonuclease domain-containing protein [Halanaerobacter jeridensis]|uniref:DNA polymerase-3 subunit epsilon n=1 Tax=Halanaerobacter jeridensis TaxID=706427 RepID=A0A939BPI2_9FIRM|nr:exonuclease domain-containing protein [Halanaerobacter jeridensis]MBM7556883.1 DNA polymerase-3 subunit epsilon [Halanaerobacter jeridensis]